MINLDEILAEHSNFLQQELQKMIAKKRIKGKQILSGSIRSRSTSDNESMTGKHELTFLDDGRFVDMGAGRMRKIESVETNGALLAARKAKKWYSKTAFGITYGRLVPKLIVNLQENTLEGIKDALQRRKESFQK